MLMSFTEPLSITISGVTTPLPRVSDDKADGVYRSGDGRVELVANHQEGKRVRHTVRVNTSKIAADPFRDDQNVELSMSCYVVFDLPTVGYTGAEALASWKGLTTLLAASSDAMVVKLLGGES
jgi:hypothetical protein